MLIDEIKNDARFRVREREDAELYSLQIYEGEACIFNESKIKCPYESMRNLKKIINAKLENKFLELNINL